MQLQMPKGLLAAYVSKPMLTLEISLDKYNVLKSDRHFDFNVLCDCLSQFKTPIYVSTTLV